MKNYYRIMQGHRSVYAKAAREGNFIAVGFIKDKDLSQHLSDNFRDFNKEFIPVFLEQNPEKGKIAAGLACGMLWTVARGMRIGDTVLCPDGAGNYYIGEVVSEYAYHQGEILPHRRSVHWLTRTISKGEVSQAFKNSLGAIGTVSDVSKYADEIEALIGGARPSVAIASDATIENPSEFVLEKHLEDFLVQNWAVTELGNRFDIYQEDGEMVGQQYPSDTGPIDILAISKDKKEIAVIELKKGRASDVVVGQVQRYMGYVKDELAEKDQSVRGIIIAFEDDIRINRALSVAPNIEFYTYKINFKLEKK